MRRAPSLLLTGITICVIGLLSAEAQETTKATKAEKPQIPGGIEGHVKRVDVEKATLTIVTTSGAERTFSVTDDTTMLGPRGGKVRRRLHDPRFHEGMELTVVASGSTAKEVHLGYSLRAGDAAKVGGTVTGKATAKPKAPPAGGASTAPTTTAKVPTKKGDVAAATPSAAEEEDEDDELPGTVKSYNADRRLLVVTLLNGTNRSFLLSRDLNVVVGRAVSKQGVADSAIKEGARVTVFLEEGGRRVKELHVIPASSAGRMKKAS
jgi:hypothetical protein